MKIKFALITITAIFILGSCGKDSSPPAINPQTLTVPTVTTASAVTIFNVTSASSGGTVVADGGTSITARGVCWATNSNPTIADNVVYSGVGTGTGTFGATMHNLTPGATYFVKAFATNSVGTAYGAAVMFTVTTGTPAGDVYAAGNLNNGPVSIPTIWKNGAPTPLTIPMNPAEAYSVSLSGTDVYVSGYARNGITDMARLWKNGIGSFLTNSNNGGGKAWSVDAAGLDVYVAGESIGPANTMATLWKNGAPTFLSAGASPAAAYSVFVSFTDVYVAGKEGNLPKIWKNGVATPLINGPNPAIVYCVTVFFPDVYGAGAEIIGTKSAAKFWKNNVGTLLTNGAFDAVAYSVYTTFNLGTGTDVYVVGYENNGTKNVAKFWKNGAPTSLTDGTNNAVANSVYGSGTDIYIGGYENDGTKNIAKLWKNGLEIPLQNSATAGSIAGVFVK